MGNGRHARGREPWVLWGAELSPFALKVELLLRFVGLPYAWMPRDGGFREAVRFALRRRRLVAGRLPQTWPRMTELDEYPLVPFLFGPGGENLVDSSAIGEWLDRAGSLRGEAAALVPGAAPAVHFAVRLLDEAFDEVGLYLVHHNRWVVSARDNDAGRRLAAEMRPLLGPGARLLARTFPARQVRRLPYLLSVADPADRSFDDLPRPLRPPAREGFPATHALLDQLFRELVAAVEPVLASRPFLLGDRFTLADASLYGQLGMNRSDPSAWARLRHDAPATAAWLERLAAGDFRGHRDDGTLRVDDSLEGLLGWVSRGFVPLMQQNRDAWVRHRAAGESRFNEAAFDRGRALYDGTLCGRPYRNAVKTFQVRVWRDLRWEWERLERPDRARLEALLPEDHGLGRDGFGEPGPGAGR